ncbi:hypothetical protein BV20DRAFT_974415 [Pilatotrama ljubarskyi]|nr:hypothetical protein BV20DRAFT_974415 [Pilatotrama ljubarskyi]
MSQSSLAPPQMDQAHDAHVDATSVGPQPSSPSSVSTLDLNEDDVDTIPISCMTISGGETQRAEDDACPYLPHSQSMPAPPASSRTWSASTWLDDEEPLIITPIRHLLEHNTILGSPLSDSPAPSRRGTMDSEESASALLQELAGPPDSSRSSSMESSWTPTAARTCFGAVGDGPCSAATMLHGCAHTTGCTAR